MARPRKVIPIERINIEQGMPPEPEGFAAYVARFKADNPELWESLRLCPLQHGLDEMAACLNS